jgi:signal transduction histidine kinase
VLKKFNTNPPVSALKTVSEEITHFEASRYEGVTLILSGVIKRIFSDKKELSGLLTVARDVTAVRREEKLKRDFLSLMSHKLKTPLVAITGYTPLLLEDQQTLQTNPFLKKAIEAIHTQGLHLKELVEKLILFSLIEAEELTVDSRPHQVRRILEETLTGMKSYLDSKGVMVILDDSLDALPLIPLDEDKFRQVFKGLIENAAKFNSKQDKKVILSGMHGGNEVSISVQDNGNGIPSQEFDKIFNKFYQIEESFTGQVEGAGLGLALVKRLVEVQSGTIQLESKVGEGSTFTVTLPL